jgi:hypothetical protein
MRCSFGVLALVLILGFAGKLSAQVADPAPRPVLAYEGRLVESNTFVTGLRTFVFSVIDSNGNELWNSGTQTLTVTTGLYGVVLGSAGMPALPASLTLRANLHLRVIADGVQLSPDVPLIPAFQAGTAWNVIGPFYGDISGTQQTISVNKLKGTPIDLATPLSWPTRTSRTRRPGRAGGCHRRNGTARAIRRCGIAGPCWHQRPKCSQWCN